MKAYIFNIHDVVLLMTAAECLLLAVFQLVLPARERNQGLLLTAFLLIVATASACTLLLWNDQIPALPLTGQLLPYFLFAALMLKGPAIYLYVTALTQRGLRLRRRHALHLIPALALLIGVFFFDLTSNKLRYIAVSGQEVPEQLVDLIWDLATLIPLAYAAAGVLLVRRYKAELKNEYSHFSTTELSWLNILTLGVLASWGWTLIVHVAAKYTSVETADHLGIADNYVTFILINAFFAYSLAYAHQLLATRPQQSREPENSEAPSAEAIALVQRAVEVDKLYLKKNLNLEQFSERVGLPAKEVSAVINKHFGTNFFEFINSYRVEEAKALLADESKAEMTVLDVLLESGFNSKSAFHRFFSRLVGISPSEYRKRALQGRGEATSL
ncbi:helix-turn-helix domain-containing protein [Microbulbifer rhizosphaerae]|uniref:AraC-like DNA-binding protein n=1 Tax=Microbulbifer rhizosphaerae TaxID=1562603 RepID=A0A7W4ZBK2_9GAMM|nr:helix-turn-helix domain-containing protein [Microbulbifer rhizosphaerae]MBB3062474.1 AraC-like DNA-binding protein [Microbulbifer rhizosphaerae]